MNGSKSYCDLHWPQCYSLACVTEWAVTTGLLTRSVADATLIPELKYARCLIDATCLPTQFSMRHVMTFTYVGRVCEGTRAAMRIASCCDMICRKLLQWTCQKKVFRIWVIGPICFIYHYIYRTFHIDYVWIHLIIQITTCENDNHHSERNHSDRIRNRIFPVNID